MQVPRLTKVTLNMGVGEAKQDSKMLEAAEEQLGMIAGQRPSIRRARKSIAAFKLREEMPVGLSVTLRGARMWEFIDRLVSVALPRVRDFRGLNPRSLRRPRQLEPGHPRADHLPRDRLRRDRPGARARRGGDHHRRHRRGGVRAAGPAGHALPGRRAGPASRTCATRRPRRGPPRRRGPRPRRKPRRWSSSRRKTRRPMLSPSPPRTRTAEGEEGGKTAEETTE